MTVILNNGLMALQHVNATTSKHFVKVLVVNLMPNKLETERQFVHLLSHLSVDVAVTFLRMSSHRSKHTDERLLAQNYASLSSIYHQHFDGMIVTGAPVEEMAFEKVDYWAEFQALMDWRKQHVSQSIFECWAAQAGVYADFGIQKQVTNAKLFGVYRCRINQRTELTAGLDRLSMPQSRHATLGAINNPALRVVASDPEAGPVVLTSASTHSTYISGHPEYETKTLFNEFHRDQEKGLPIQLPKNYFSAAVPVNTWQNDSIHLYNNWVHQLTRDQAGIIS